MVKNTPKEEFISVGCASDDNYVQHMGVMIYSLLENCSKPSMVRLFVASAGISNINKKRLESIARRFHSEIRYIEVDLSILKDLKTYRHLGIGTYLRFILIERLKIKKLLFLDCDIVVLDDVNKLFNLKFKKNVIFAVKDPGISKRKKITLGLRKNKNYFNAGVMLVDCKRWKSLKIMKKSLDYLKNNPKKVEFADQEALNVILSDSWREIDPKWNVITRFFYSRVLPWIRIHDYNESEIKMVRKHPKIIHYATTIKPWFFLDINPQKKLYWKYLRKTPWKDYRAPDSNLLGIFKRIQDYFRFILNKANYLRESQETFKQ